LQHRQTVNVGAEDLVRLVRRTPGREENDLFEVEVVAHDLGDDQMTDMDRIKGATKDGELSRRGHAVPTCQTDERQSHGALDPQYSSVIIGRFVPATVG
jgi:hypothetical protein